MRSIRFSTLLTLLLIVWGQAAIAAGRDPYAYFFNETWGDFTEELKKAREQGKKGILIFFELDECPFCHRMKRIALNQPEVQTYYRRHFLNFSVDIEGAVEIVDFHGESTNQKDFAFKANRVRATPVFVFYDLDGKPIVRYTGATSGMQEFLWLGEFVTGGHYRDMRFTQYKRQQNQAARQAR